MAQPTAAAAARAQAAEHYERGLSLAQAGQLEAAGRLFESAYSLAPHPDVSFNLALVSLKLGDQQRAKYWIGRHRDDLGATPTAAEEARLTQLEESVQQDPADEHGSVEQAPRDDGASPGRGSAKPPFDNESAPEHSAGSELVQDRSAAARREEKGTRSEPARIQPPAPPSYPALPEERENGSGGFSSGQLGGLTLGGVGVSFLVSGAALWLWADDRYGDALSQHEALNQEELPEFPADNAELEMISEHSFARGRLEREFDNIETLDTVTWITLEHWSCLHRNGSRDLLVNRRRAERDRRGARWTRLLGCLVSRVGALAAPIPR